MPKRSRQEFMWEFRRIKGREGKIDLPDEILKYRYDFLLVADELTDFKLTVPELNQTFIFLSGLLLGKYPKIIAVVKNTDIIKIPYSVLGQLPFTKLKLTKEEKLILSFAVFYAVRTEFYDERSKKTHKGIRKLDSAERVMNLLEWDRDNNPERYKFTLLAPPPSKTEPFALSIDNPVKAASISDGYKYLNRLRAKDGSPVKYQRIGSVYDFRRNVIEVYKLEFLYETMTIYINSHARNTSQEAPEGLMLKPDEDGDENKEFLAELKARAKTGKGKEDFELGQKYYLGQGVNRSYKEAFNCFMQSAEHGYVEAMTRIGLMYARGYGVEHSFSEAAKWYSMAAEADDPEALHNLGVLYCEGRGVERDMERAVEMWYRAAEQGYEQSQVHLGIMYLSEGNRDEAMKWLRRAAQQGSEEAKSMLEGMMKQG